jgi:hypothetical protein
VGSAVDVTGHGERRRVERLRARALRRE